MNPTFTVTAILNEAAGLEEQAARLREAAKAIQEISTKRMPGKPTETNGILLSAIPASRKAKPAKTGKKRRYTKRSAFWSKKKK